MTGVYMKRNTGVSLKCFHGKGNTYQYKTSLTKAAKDKIDWRVQNTPMKNGVLPLFSFLENLI